MKAKFMRKLDCKFFSLTLIDLKLNVMSGGNFHWKLFHPFFTAYIMQVKEKVKEASQYINGTAAG